MTQASVHRMGQSFDPIDCAALSSWSLCSNNLSSEDSSPLAGPSLSVLATTPQHEDLSQHATHFKIQIIIKQPECSLELKEIMQHRGGKWMSIAFAVGH